MSNPCQFETIMFVLLYTADFQHFSFHDMFQIVLLYGTYIEDWHLHESVDVKMLMLFQGG